MTRIERIDSHTHSAYSGHGSGSVSDVIDRAEELGLTSIAQTEHLVLPKDMDPSFESSMSPEQMHRYLDDLHKQRERLLSKSSKTQLVMGIEADWLPGRTDELERLCADFEYVLGSVHFLDTRPLDDSRDLSLWEERGIDEVWRGYFETWLDMAAHPGPIMAFAHPDLPKKYGWLPSFDMHEYYHEMAHVTARSGRMVEVNTAGLRKDVGQMYPALELLRVFYDAGVDCTIGSDAHAPRDVADHFDDAVQLMQQAGYKRLTVPTPGGDRRYVALDA